MWLLLAVAALRLVTMALLPMSDTTEPRYAETARLMAESGDWITPWFEPGVPFWGKPPLAFWAQAASIELFGLSDFVVRLPSWLVMAAIVWLTMHLARALGGDALSRLSGLVLASMALVFIGAGAVMTDPFLAFGTTLSLASLALVSLGNTRPWRWMFFVGLAVGLLAKGPLTLVLVGLPAGLWALCSRAGRRALRTLPWLGGAVLTLAAVVPWYVVAESKTPGFLDYFLIGEHFRRFVTPGWEGDLYGSAHHEIRGTIWLFLLWAGFPWSLIAAALSVRWLARWRARAGRTDALFTAQAPLLLLATLTPIAFFSFAGNILWTYALPSLPFLAILIARELLPTLEHRKFRIACALMAALVPLTVTGAGLYLSVRPERLDSAAPLLTALRREPGGESERLHFVGRIPFSARYYSRGRAQSMSAETLADLVRDPSHRLFLAVRNDDLPSVVDLLGEHYELRFRGARHSLLVPRIQDGDQGVHAFLTKR